jgi:16S rRNA (uracil1498-N3)-methyltransferase
MPKKDVIKLPRLCVDEELKNKAIFLLDNAKSHYLKNVLRIQAGQEVRVFNGQDGEWLATVEFKGKKTVQLQIEKQTRIQKVSKTNFCLAFAMIKKNRMDYLIEKAVELGVDTFLPLITDHGEIQKMNKERLERQIKEAAEQCERLSIPVLLNPQKLLDINESFLGDYDAYACLERTSAINLKNVSSNEESMLVFIGPEGGFSQREKDYLEEMEQIKIVSLGENVLRSETAAIAAILYLK